MRLLRTSGLLWFALLVPAHGKDVRLTCAAKQGVEQVHIDIEKKMVRIEELHDERGFRSHAILLFQDGSNTSVVQEATANGATPKVARQSGPQTVSVTDEKIAFSGTLYGDFRSYEIDRSSGIMSFTTLDRKASGQAFGPFFSRCTLVRAKMF